MLKLIEMMNQAGFFIIPANAKVTRVKHFTQFIADQIDDGLKIQLRGQPLLDRVDDLQLRNTFLFGFEEAGIFESRAERGGDGG